MVTLPVRCSFAYRVATKSLVILIIDFHDLQYNFKKYLVTITIELQRMYYSCRFYKKRANMKLTELQIASFDNENDQGLRGHSVI